MSISADIPGIAFATSSRSGAVPTAPTAVRFGSLQISGRRAGRADYTLTLAVGDAILRDTVRTHGPADAVTTLLYRAGIRLEIHEFHQRTTASGVVTDLRAQQDRCTEWATGTGADAAESTARALVAAANLTA